MVFKTAIIGCAIMGQRTREHMVICPDFDPKILRHLWDPFDLSRAAAKRIVPDAETASNAAAAIDNAELVYLACSPILRTPFA